MADDDWENTPPPPVLGPKSIGRGDNVVLAAFTAAPLLIVRSPPTAPKGSLVLVPVIDNVPALTVVPVE